MPNKVAIIIEYHTSASAVVGGQVQTKEASVYVATGVSAGDVFGLYEMSVPGAQYVCVASKVPLEVAERLCDALSESLIASGCAIEMGQMFDE